MEVYWHVGKPFGFRSPVTVPKRECNYVLTNFFSNFSNILEESGIGIYLHLSAATKS